MALVDVLIPTFNRLTSLVMTLSGVAAQTLGELRVIVADQSERPVGDEPVVQALRRIVSARGGSVEWHTRPQVHGIAEQRQFLLERSRSELVLYLDDDVFMEPWVVERLRDALLRERCGFVGAFPAGLSFAADARPEQQVLELWDGPVRPETVEKGTPAWERWNLHRAANVLHAARRIPPGETRLYKVAWVSCCVLFDRAKLLEVGGFGFWRELPRFHAGEEVLVENLLMRRWGGAAMLPSGTYHSQVPTTVQGPRGDVDGQAMDLLPRMLARLEGR